MTPDNLPAIALTDRAKKVDLQLFSPRVKTSQILDDLAEGAFARRALQRIDPGINPPLRSIILFEWEGMRLAPVGFSCQHPPSHIHHF